jgi:two-component system CheB/CheR fusion protein
MLGDAEAIGTAVDLFEPVDKEHRIYTRKSVPTRFSMNTGAGSKSLVVPVRSSPPAMLTGTELQKRVDRVFHQKYSPAAVVVDAGFQIVQFRGHTSAYLDPSPGEASLNVLRMARETLVVPLRRVLRSVAEKNVDTVAKGFIVDAGGAHRDIDIAITPIAGTAPSERYYLIVFEDATGHPDQTVYAPEAEGPDSDLEARSQQAQRDLAEAREQLRALSEDHAAHLEELRSANEEISSANEELQSTNEELSTTKEELQSSNEELTTVNEELRNRNQQLNTLNSDLNNVLDSVNIPILIVDNDIRIRRFTDASAGLLHLTSVDIRRPLAHVRGPFPAPKLEDLARSALDTLHAQQEEMQDHHGRWFSVSIRPYRTLDNHIDGAVLAFIDIDPLKRSLQTAERARDYADSLIETVREPLVVLDTDLKVRRATKAFYETFQVSREETEGRFLYGLGNGQWNLPRLRELLTEALFRGVPFQDFELQHEFPYIGKRTVRLNGRRIPLSDHESPLVLLAAEDVTARKEAAELRYLRLFETSKDGMVVLDAESGVVTDVNPYFLGLTGYSREQ